MKIRFSIPGNPTAQKRHRTVTRDRSGKPLPFARTYDPSAAAKVIFLKESMEYAPPSPALGVVIITFAFWMPIPKSRLKAVGDLATHWDGAIEGKPDLYSCFRKPLCHIIKPDNDNLEKFVLDALNGVFWKDDCQVQVKGKFKMYSHEPRTELEIYLEGGEHRGEDN